MPPYDRERHGPRRVVGPGFHRRVYEAVNRVPPGRLTTYGDVAAHLGLTTAARHVGFALAALPPGGDVCWHRVVNGRGRISFPPGSPQARRQRRLLKAEGIDVTPDGRIPDFPTLRCESTELL